MIDREEYEKNLREIQKAHLESISHKTNVAWQPCLHDECSKCHGTGISLLGPCVHAISCNCPKCAIVCGV